MKTLPSVGGNGIVSGMTVTDAVQSVLDVGFPDRWRPLTNEFAVLRILRLKVNRLFPILNLKFV